MPDKRLLLISNSTNYGGTFLGHALGEIADFLTDKVNRILFIPFAAVRFSYDEYEDRTASVLGSKGFEVHSIHRALDSVKAVEEAEAFAVGGGNTFHLVSALYEYGLIEPVRRRVLEGIPYFGWSAGANVACPTLRTTNDMPIVEPRSFRTFNLVPFQINPHYTDQHPEGHKGETREERILEFVEVNPGVPVVGLREGSMLRIESERIQLSGEKPVRIFLRGRDPIEYGPTDSLEFLLT